MRLRRRRPLSRDAALALPFGVGMGLTLDESALLLELEDVYWSREDSSASTSRWR